MYVFRHVARVGTVATDGRATESSKECRAGAGATVAGRSGIALDRAAAESLARRAWRPKRKVTIQTVRTRRPFHVVSTPSTHRLDGVCSRWRDVRSLDLHAIDATSARLTGEHTQAKLVTDEVQNTGLRRLGASSCGRRRPPPAAAAARAQEAMQDERRSESSPPSRCCAFSSTNCEAKVFGSCAYGLDAASSDVDLVITNWCDGELIEDRPYVAYVLLRFAQHLRAEPSVVVDRVLDRARVPVIRATIYVDDGSVPVDVSLECASHTGLAAAELGTKLGGRGVAARARRRCGARAVA